MIIEDILEDAKRIFGECDLPSILTNVDDAVELLANKGDWDPLLGFADLCCQGPCIALPRIVDVPIAINVGGHPTIPRNSLWRFHYNGMGDCGTSCAWEWVDQGNVATYFDLPCPAKLVAVVDNEEDIGKELWVYGRDDQQRVLRTQMPDGSWQDGILIPTLYSVSVPNPTAPCVAHIDRVRKQLSVGPIRLQTLDASSGTGTVLGAYDWDETDPQYRRIKLSRSCDFVRIAFRRRVFKSRSIYDPIPIHSRYAMKMAMTAVKFYNQTDFNNGQAFEATAARLIEERERVAAPTAPAPPVFETVTELFPRCDQID